MAKRHKNDTSEDDTPKDLSHLSARQRLVQTEFMLSAPTFRLCPPDTGYEVAFAGRSNAGKSSAINVLTNQRQLARSSKTPGRTQMINFFAIGNRSSRLVDLPGYGYAAVPEALKNEWQVELEEYLVSRNSLMGLVLLMDSRHPLKFFDKQMLQWAKDGGLPVHILLTKADKFKYGPAKNILLNTKREMEKLDLPFTIQLFSALKKEGIDELAEVMGRWLHIDMTDEAYTEALTASDTQAVDVQPTAELTAEEQRLIDISLDSRLRPIPSADEIEQFYIDNDYDQ